jgi:hypothetical protein
MNADKEKEKRMYDETEDAGRMLNDIIQQKVNSAGPPEQEPGQSPTESEGGAKVSGKSPEESGAPGGEKGAGVEATGPEETAPGEKEKPEEAPVGALFSKMARRSPGNIRPRPGSIGSLFKTRIQKRT